MKKYLMIMAALALFQVSYGQELGKKAMEQVEAQKVAFFTRVLDLSVEESQSFWPVYNDYQEEQKSLRKQYGSSFRDRNMSEADASKAIDDYFQMQEKQLALQKNLYAELSTFMPATKLVKLQMAEQKFKQELLERIKKRREKRTNR